MGGTRGVSLSTNGQAFRRANPEGFDCQPLTSVRTGEARSKQRHNRKSDAVEAFASGPLEARMSPPARRAPPRFGPLAPRQAGANALSTNRGPGPSRRLMPAWDPRAAPPRCCRRRASRATARCGKGPPGGPFADGRRDVGERSARSAPSGTLATKRSWRLFARRQATGYAPRIAIKAAVNGSRTRCVLGNTASLRPVLQRERRKTPSRRPFGPRFPSGLDTATAWRRPLATKILDDDLSRVEKTPMWAGTISAKKSCVAFCHRGPRKGPRSRSSASGADGQHE